MIPIILSQKVMYNSMVFPHQRVHAARMSKRLKLNKSSKHKEGER